MKKLIAIIIVAVILVTGIVALAFSNTKEIEDIINIFQEENDDNNLEAQIVVDRTEVYVNENITFDAANSTGDIVEWLWDFGDGNLSYEPITLHGYVSSKYYNVYLTVKDKKGNKDIESITLKINNKNYFDESSGQVIMTPRGGFITGDCWLYFPVLTGTANATVCANWSAQSTGALISLYLEDIAFGKE
ncbi:MAG: PKD domain-containing protein [Thermoplasmata archaeon]|nr:MAG: PKD domain-containing protein [Thermoplasmata archaeon]